MSLPDEEVRSLKRTHKFMCDILAMRVSDFRKMKKEGFEEWRQEAYYCIKHYPIDFEIDKRWSDEVCLECGRDRRWHEPDCNDKDQRPLGALILGAMKRLLKQSASIAHLQQND